MVQKELKLFRLAMEYVNKSYPIDCPYYIKLVSEKFQELKSNNKL